MSLESRWISQNDNTQATNEANGIQELTAEVYEVYAAAWKRPHQDLQLQLLSLSSFQFRKSLQTTLPVGDDPDQGWKCHWPFYAVLFFITITKVVYDSMQV